MTLRFEIPILGVELFRVSLDIVRNEPEEVTVVDHAAKGISRWFVKRMTS